MTSSETWVYTPAGKRILRVPELPKRDLISHLLKNRFIRKEERDLFLYPSPDDFVLWEEWQELSKTVYALYDAVSRGDPLHLHADYDVDGISSLVMLRAVLRAAGASVSYSLPHRFREGYGLHLRHVEEAERAGAKVLVTLDNGSNASRELAAARKRGLHVIVIDHHGCDGLPALPPGVIFCNPSVSAPSGCRHLATAGVVMKICEGLARLGDLRVSRSSLMRMAVLGTLCDQVPLIGENRTIARLGLKYLSVPKNPFLTCLFQNLGIRGKPSVSDITFRVGPRLNAPGRLGDASGVVDSFFLPPDGPLDKAVQSLNLANRERQKIQEKVWRQARERVAPEEPVVVLKDPSWHYGVLGIVAARLARELDKPVILLGGENDVLKGSGRSVKGVNLHHLIRKQEEFLNSGGGHPMAVGITLRKENFSRFKESLTAEAHQVIGNRRPTLESEALLNIDDLNGQTLKELRSLAPHGPGNPDPVFYSTGLSLHGTPRAMGSNHLMLRVSGEKRILPAVFWDGQSCGALPARLGIVYTIEPEGRYPSRLVIRGFHSA